MDKETNVVAKPEVVQAIRKAINDLLKEGAQSADVAFCLAFMSLDLALQMAPSPANAMTLVTSALSHAAKAHCPEEAQVKERQLASSHEAADSIDTAIVDSGPQTIH